MNENSNKVIILIFEKAEFSMEEIVMENKSTTFNMNGGQMIIAKDNATMYITQNNGTNAKELEDIIKGIMENVDELKKEDAESIKDTLEIVKEEISKQNPKVSRLRNCVTLIAPMFTIVNGIPNLRINLQRLVDFIMSYIQ